MVQAEDCSIRGLGEQKFLTGFTKLKRWFHGDFVVVLLWFPWLNFCLRLTVGMDTFLQCCVSGSGIEKNPDPVPQKKNPG